MQYYICTECKFVFNLPTQWEERHGLDCAPYEEIAGCPLCMGVFVPAIQCDVCGEFVEEDEAVHTTDNGTVCKNCWNELEGGEE